MQANLNDRSTYLGGSDAAGILGLSPWATPLDIYYRKIGYPDGLAPVMDFNRQKILKRGKRMEPVVIDMLRDEYPIKIVRQSTPDEPNRYADKDYPFMAAEIDFEWEVTPEMVELFPAFSGLPIGSIQNGEVKTVHPFGTAEWGDMETDQIPIQYAAQSWHGLGITRRKACLYPLLIGSDNLVLYQVLAEDDIVATMRARLASFWHNHVIARVPPPPLRMTDVYRMLRVRQDIDVQADGELQELVKRLDLTAAAQKAAKEQYEELQFLIGKKVLGESVETKTTTGRHRVMVGQNPILTIALQQRTNINAELLEQRWPEAYRACEKISKYFVYRRPRSK